MRPLFPVFVACSVSLVSCRSEVPDVPPPATATPDEVAAEEAQPESVAPVYIYDAQGALIPSDEFIVGIQLPRGLKLFREQPGLHVYRIQAPIRKVLSYFGPMLMTGNVERQGKGAVYRKASVRGGEVNPTKVDVSILEIGGGMTRVSITELPPPPAYPPEQRETLQRAKRDFKMLD